MGRDGYRQRVDVVPVAEPAPSSVPEAARFPPRSAPTSASGRADEAETAATIAHIRAETGGRQEPATGVPPRPAGVWLGAI